MIADYIRFSVTGIMQRKLRSWLTMIGIFIGIMAVVSLISLGQGMQDAIDEQFESVGSNRVMVTPGGGLGGVAGMAGSELTSAKLYDRDLDFVRNVKGVEYAIGVLTKSDRLSFRGESKYAAIFATDFSQEAQKFLDNIDYFMVGEGRQLKNSDKYKATVGVEIASELFNREISRGDTITINDIGFEVVGINKDTGNPFHDSKVTIPIDTAREIYGLGDELMTISVETKEDVDPGEVADRITKELRRDHGLKEGEEDFSVSTASQMIGSFKDILDVVQAVLVGIAAISLMVGGVGIMNTMYTSVLERTSQIGIMKAVGARNNDIMLLFLIEAGLLGVVGGVIGVLLGLGISKAVEYIAAQNGFDILQANMSLQLILGALAFSFLVGSISGVLPARKAALMKPVEAIRYR